MPEELKVGDRVQVEHAEAGAVVRERGEVVAEAHRGAGHAYGTRYAVTVRLDDGQTVECHVDRVERLGECETAAEELRVELMHEHTSGMHSSGRDVDCDMCREAAKLDEARRRLSELFGADVEVNPSENGEDDWAFPVYASLGDGYALCDLDAAPVGEQVAFMAEQLREGGAEPVDGARANADRHAEAAEAVRLDAEQRGTR